MARRTKYTPDVVQRLETAIAAGATYRLACGYAGISEDTLARWREHRADFADMLVRAEASAALRWLARIEQAGAEDWRALAWKLERRYPQEYGRTVQEQRVQHSGTITQQHSGTVEVRAIDYRHSIRALAPLDREDEPPPPRELTG